MNSFLVDTLSAQDMEMEEGVSPRVGGRQRLSSSSETATPKTPRSAKVEDTTFFGSNFSLEALAEVASLQTRPGISKYYMYVHCLSQIGAMQFNQTVWNKHS